MVKEEAKRQEERRKEDLLDRFRKMDEIQDRHQKEQEK